MPGSALFFLICLNQRTNHMAAIINTITSITGAKKDKIEISSALTHSPVEMTGFPTPPVVAVDKPRKATVPNCTAPAVPPPTINAVAQAINCDISPLLTAIVDTVPAMTAAGVAIMSRILSTQGI